MTEKKIIGRKEEIRSLKEALDAKEAHFVAVYGRRRVGKTFLIREFFLNKGVYLEATGIKNAPLSRQLEHFSKVFADTFYDGAPLRPARRWDEAFELLTEQIKKVAKSKRIIVFLDELPWMATPRSGLIEALDYYWNRYWSTQKNLVLIVCGSAASWMLDHLIHAKGGLHNRLTKRIWLEPFTLKETQRFLEARKISLNQKQILDLYMAIGGIPYYLKEIKRGRSTGEILNELCFKKSGLLFSEFEHLFASLFDQAELNLSLVRAIAQSGNALTRKQLMQATGLSSGGTLNRKLKELEASNFIRCFIPYGNRARDRTYRVTDEYTLFYLRWIEPLVMRGLFSKQESYWQKIVNTSARLVWAGHAFESVCFKHLSQIEVALGLDKIAHLSGSWHYIPPKRSKEEGAQIDLLFDRDDGSVTVCEIKYSDKLYVIQKSYAQALDRKIDVYCEKVRGAKAKQIFLAFISTKGVKKNMYKEDLVDAEVTLNDLFK